MELGDMAVLQIELYRYRFKRKLDYIASMLRVV